MVDADRQLLLYTLWADRLMLDAVREVTPEDLTRDAGVSFGSLLGTMAHMLALAAALARPLHRAASPTAVRPGGLPGPGAAWIAGWEETAAGMEAFLAALTEEQLAAEITWEDTELGPVTRPLWQPVTHMVNHSPTTAGRWSRCCASSGTSPRRRI